MAIYGPPPAQDKPALPEYMARKGEGVMDDQELHSIVQGALSQSVQFVDTELSFERARATEFYLGKPFGNEEEGRSQAILTEVRDAVDGVTPDFMEVFFGAEEAVEFVPNKPTTVEMASQKTDYVRYVFEQDNAGFLQALSVAKDGFVRKIGIFKWWWDDSVRTSAYRMEHLTKPELDELAAEDGVELQSVRKLPPTKEDKAAFQKAMQQYDAMIAQQPPGPNTPPPPQMPVYYDVDLTRVDKGGRARIASLPPEEFIYNRQARDLSSALLVFHRTDKTRGELLAMGIKEEDIDDHAGGGNSTDVTLKGNAEEIARRDIAGVGRVVGFGYTNDPDTGTANAKILYCEGLMHIDYDGDGIAELRRVCTIGPTYYPVQHYPDDGSMGFAVFTPYPEPHTLLGGSLADRLMDVQKINSSLLRGMLDSLSASIFPRTVYQEGQASVADIMNTAIGQPIRSRGDVNATIRTLDIPFVGKEAMPVLQFMQDVIERRVSRNNSQGGQDKDALQSTTPAAAIAALSGSQKQLSLMARVFAEMTLKPLFKGVGRLLTMKQPRSRMVRLRGQWVEVDPRTWDEDMDVTVNVAMGTTFTDKKIQTLMMVAADQTQIIQQLGPSNPLVSLSMLRNTKAKILALQGIKDVDNYYKPIDPNWQPPPQQPPPDPNVLALQQEAEMNKLKTLKELAIKRDELAFEVQKGTWEQEFKLRELASNTEVKLAGINAQWHANISTAALEAAISQDQTEAELTIQAHDNLHSHDIARSDQALQQQQMEAEPDTSDTAEPAEGAE